MTRTTCSIDFKKFAVKSANQYLKHGIGHYDLEARPIVSLRHYQDQWAVEMRLEHPHGTGALRADAYFSAADCRYTEHPHHAQGNIARALEKTARRLILAAVEARENAPHTA